MSASVQLIADLGGGWDVTTKTYDNDGHPLSVRH